MVARETGRKPLFAPVPFFAAAVMAKVLQFAPVPPLTPDQVTLLRIDNVAAPDAPGLADLGVSATAAELILPTYLRDHRRGSSQNRRPWPKASVSPANARPSGQVVEPDQHRARPRARR